MGKSQDLNGESIVICPSCDLAVLLHAYRRGYQCRCPRCKRLLRPANEISLTQGAAVAISAILMMLCALPLPFFSLSSAGNSASFSLLSLCFIFEDWFFLAALFVSTVLLLPLCMLLIICAIGFLGYKPSKTVATVYSFCHICSFVDVFVLAVAISLVKITSLATVDFLSGFYLFIIFSWMTVWCWNKYRPVSIWKLVGEGPELQINLELNGKDQGIKICRRCSCAFVSHAKEAVCPRCGMNTSFRQKSCGQKCVALLLAASILFLPSNLYPVMFTTYLGNTEGSNIVEGALFLWKSGSWLVASVIIVASLFIPGFKILALSYLSFKVNKGAITNPIALSRLFHLVEFIGKWSMLDVFVVIIMTVAVRFGGLMSIAPGLAILTFCLVVLVTLWAAASFDERLIWDKYVEKK